jgi:hypothetical protein
MKPKNYYGSAFDKDMKNDYRQKRWAKEREKHGFDDTEIWSLDVTLLLFLYPRLKKLVKTRASLFEFETTDPVADLYNYLTPYYKKDKFNGLEIDNDTFLDLFANAYGRMWY